MRDKAKELRDKAKRLEEAQEWARGLLKKRFTVKEKVAAFDKMRRLANEYVECLLDDGYVTHHVTDAFEERVLLTIHGDDFYDKIGPLR